MADRYRVVSGTHYRRGRGDSRNYKFTPGDILELSEQEQASFGDKFELTTEGKLSEGGSLKEFEANRAKAARPAKAKVEVKEPAAAAPGPNARSRMVDKLGLGPATALIKAGFSTITQAKKLSDEELVAIKGVGAGTVKKLRGG